MDAATKLLDLLKKKGLVKGHLLGFLHVFIGRRISNVDGELISTGLAWRDLAALLKKIRLEPELVHEVGLDPADMPPRDRQRLWYTVIARAAVDSEAAAQAGDRFAEILKSEGYVVGPAPKE